MALQITNKATSQSSSTPSRSVQRSEVQMGRPTVSTSRVQALKNRLKVQSQPPAPRPARPTGRAEQMATLQKYTTPQAQKPVISPRNEARSRDVNFNNIAPPPSGLAPGQQEPVAQLPTSVEAPPKVAEAPSDQQ